MAVNAPEAGVIKEFLVNEEDTVTVGQDIVKLDTDGQPSAGASGAEEKVENKDSTAGEAAVPKPEASSDSKAEAKKEPAPSKPAAAPAKAESKDVKPVKEASSKETTSQSSGLGSREERRVCCCDAITGGILSSWTMVLTLLGQNEPYASPHRRAP